MQISIGTNPIYSTITEDLEKQGITGDFSKFDKAQDSLFLLRVKGYVTESEHKKAFNRLFKDLVKTLEKEHCDQIK